MSSISRGQSSLTVLRMIGEDMMITNYYVDFYAKKNGYFSVFKDTKKSLLSGKKIKKGAFNFAEGIGYLFLHCLSKVKCTWFFSRN